MSSVELSPQEIETVNRCEVTPLIIGCHYNIFMPIYDRGIDFILHREENRKTFFVQLKGRLTVDKKYEKRGIYLLFPNTDNRDDQNRQWYLVEHDELIKLTKATGLNIEDSKDWEIKEKYSVKKLSSKLLAVLEAYKLEDVLNKTLQ